jgi:hypothetical protein
MPWLRHVLFGAVVLFWAAMNFLLIRSEFAGRNELRGAVPVEMVWDRILTSPDDSAMDILFQGQKVGHLRWRSLIAEELRQATTEEGMEGRVATVSEYLVDLDGHIALDEGAPRLRLRLQALIRTNHVWKRITLKGTLRPTSWELEVDSVGRTVTLTTEEGSERSVRQMPFETLQNPAKLLGELGVSALPLGPGALPLPGAGKGLQLGLQWTARHDWLRIGRSRTGAYRLSARLIEGYEAVILVSRAGEILRVELPREILLINEVLVSL